MSDFHAATPILNVKNLQASMDYYVQKLGFEKKWDWGDPPSFGGVICGHSEIFLCQDGQGARGGPMPPEDTIDDPDDDAAGGGGTPSIDDQIEEDDSDPTDGDSDEDNDNRKGNWHHIGESVSSTERERYRQHQKDFFCRISG